jgi:hypothetical protein
VKSALGCNGSWKLVTQTPRFVSLSGDSYDYTGGAHGQPASYGLVLRRLAPRGRAVPHGLGTKPRAIGLQPRLQPRYPTQTPRFVSLSGDSYDYTGGAHGQPASYGLVWDKAARSQQQRQLLDRRTAVHGRHRSLSAPHLLGLQPRDSYDYTGGAHGQPASYGLVWDKATGRPLQPRALIAAIRKARLRRLAPRGRAVPHGLGTKPRAIGLQPAAFRQPVG